MLKLQRLHEVFDVERFDGLQRIIGGSIVQDVNSEILECLAAQAFQAPRNVARAVERDDVHRNPGRHYPFNAPKKTFR